MEAISAARMSSSLCWAGMSPAAAAGGAARSSDWCCCSVSSVCATTVMTLPSMFEPDSRSAVVEALFESNVITASQAVLVLQWVREGGSENRAARVSYFRKSSLLILPQKEKKSATFFSGVLGAKPLTQMAFTGTCAHRDCQHPQERTRHGRGRHRPHSLYAIAARQ